MFFWNSRPDHHLADGTGRIEKVSILVFLELAPGHLNVSQIGNRYAGFNPCFSGTRARTADQVFFAAAFVQFQSLFFWNSRPDKMVASYFTSKYEGFNPCFSGTRARTALGKLLSIGSRSFNPCFSGTRARTELVVRFAVGPARFQSLFFWNSRPDVDTPPNRGRSSRVSILVFLELAPGLDLIRSNDVRVNVFQSLFFWNSRPDSRTRRPSPSSSSFNPCFSGTRARTKVAR